MKNPIITIGKQLVSEKDSIQDIKPMMNAIRNAIDISDEKFFLMMVAATEAVNNAIIHGNKLDRDKKTTIDISASKNLVKIEVKDNGTGFNCNCLDDPRKPENLLKEGGRGVFLIRHIADRVEFRCSACGSRVLMEFDL